jgi:hypothetical protein
MPPGLIELKYVTHSMLISIAPPIDVKFYYKKNIDNIRQVFLIPTFICEINV